MTPDQERLAALLRDYRGADPTEEQHRRAILRHVESEELWWHRDTLPGHVTASAFLVTARLDRMLLHHHRKLDRWLQPGGHDDGERDPALTVLREVQEESGLQQVDFFGQPAIFDLDIHPIPARGAMPKHDHLDVRFLLLANEEEALRPAAGESTRLQWFPIDEAEELLNELGASRVMRKIRMIAEQLGETRA